MSINPKDILEIIQSEDHPEPTRRTFELLLEHDDELKDALNAAMARAFEKATEWEMCDPFYPRQHYQIDWTTLYDNLTVRYV